MNYRPQSEQEMHNEQLEDLVFKPGPLPAKYSNLPPAPLRSQFQTQDEYEEARGYWQGHVGRIKAMADRAKATKASQQR